MQIIVGLKCKEVSEKDAFFLCCAICLLSIFCFLINGITMKNGQYL